MRIGLDFDNTIANYDQAFPKVARIIGVANTASSKRKLRVELEKSPDGERTWQRIQGLVYGRYIDEARPHEGVHEFIQRALLLGHDLFVVSHKTEYGHFDESRTPLRIAAVTWLRDHEIVGESDHSISPTRVYFSDTRAEKLSAIRELKLDIFIDDLLEVLTEPAFPNATKRVLFAPSDSKMDTSEQDLMGQHQLSRASSWKSFANELFGELTPHEVGDIAQQLWPTYRITEVSRVVGRGNSQVFRVEHDNGIAALKAYPDLVLDRRSRRATEWLALNLLTDRGQPVPTPLATSEKLNWSLLSWVSGVAPQPDDSQALQQALTFMRSLHRISHDRPQGHGLASEACMTPAEIARQIDERILQLQGLEHPELMSFLNGEVLSERNNRVSSARELLGSHWNLEVPESERILSPSDFGFHNAITTADGRVVFYDFEYFGWDDPVKLVSDFALHPGAAIHPSLAQQWIDSTCKIFEDVGGFRSRLAACMPLYSLRWTLILLNEFRPAVAQKRLLAQGNLVAELPRIQSEQLEKARQMIRRTLPLVVGT